MNVTMDRKPADDRCPSHNTPGAGSAITTPAQIAPLLDLPPEGYFEMGFSLHGLVLSSAGLSCSFQPAVV